MAERFSTPLAFKQSLEQRLKSAASGGQHLNRDRQLLVFDRFLARAMNVFGEAVVLKGGLALEFRIARARTTKDIDLRLGGAPGTTLERLQRAGRLELGDFMSFDITLDPKHPEIANAGMPYEGFRYRAVCHIAGKPYSSPFGINVAFGDRLGQAPDIITANDTLAFAGVAPPRIPIYPVTTHIAEKLHAYTLPRSRPNSRIKDLPDMALLATTGNILGEELRQALEETFDFRATHALPDEVPKPPEAWRRPYERMASQEELPWANLEELHQAVSSFLDPVLCTEGHGIWNPSHQDWQD